MLTRRLSSATTKALLCLAKDPADHQKSKHIAVHYFFICQRVEEQRVQVFCVKTIEQLADLLTKALAKAQHTILTLAVLGHSTSAALLAFYADPATRGVRFV